MTGAAQRQGEPGARLDRLLAGDTAALARAISVLEAGGARASALSRQLQPHTGRAHVIAFTGPPGTGKSTLLSAYISVLRAREERVAVLAVDPTKRIALVKALAALAALPEPRTSSPADRITNPVRVRPVLHPPSPPITDSPGPL